MMARDPLPVTLISGYLGAGKTTLVNHLLRSAEGRRLTVMVNDFGELPIDADLIEAEDGDTLTLANGCICCSMNGDLAGAFMDVLDRDPWPDHLVIEASGVAEPHRIANLARAEPDLNLNGVVVLSDASNIRSLAGDGMIGTTVLRQLADADLHLLNKTDLLDGQGEEKLREWLGASFSSSPVISCTNATVPVDLILGELGDSNAAFGTAGHDHQDLYLRWSQQSEKPYSEHRLRRALDTLPGGVLRLKGIVRFSGSPVEHIVQCVGTRRTISARSNQIVGPSRLVAIGLKSKVSADQLDELFTSCREH